MCVLPILIDLLSLHTANPVMDHSSLGMKDFTASGRVALKLRWGGSTLSGTVTMDKMASLKAGYQRIGDDSRRLIPWLLTGGWALRQSEREG